MFQADHKIKLDKDEYRIEKNIGSGGQAQVWRVARISDHALFALKIVSPYDNRAGRQTLRPQQTINELVKRAEMEISFLQELSEASEHHILPSLDSGYVRWQNYDLPAFIMPIVNEELSDYCPNISQTPKPFKLRQALTWLQQLTIAIEHIHGKDSSAHTYIHRDIKPSNILLDAQSNAFLTDFGIVKEERSVGTTSLAFSYEYCAPEQRLPLYLLKKNNQFQNRYHITPSVDLYALGAVMYSLLAGGLQAQNTLANENTVTTHSRSLAQLTSPPIKPKPVGKLGEIGGLTPSEVDNLRYRLSTLWGNGTGVSGQENILSEQSGTIMGSVQIKPDAIMNWVIEQLIQLIQKLLAPWPDDRPTAAEALALITDIQAVLSPKLQSFSLEADSYFQGDEKMQLRLEFSGEGLLANLDWLEVGLQNEILPAVRAQLISPVTSADVLASEITHQAQITLPELEQGSYEVQITAQLGEQTKKLKHKLEVVLSAQQLWNQGQHEAALMADLREEWLKQRLASSTTVIEKYNFLQLLERLRAHHPQQSGLLDVYAEFANTFEKNKGASGTKTPILKILLAKLKDGLKWVLGWLKVIAAIGAGVIVITLVADFFNTDKEVKKEDTLVAPPVPEVKKEVILAEVKPTPEALFQKAKIALDGDDQRLWSAAIDTLNSLAQSGNSEAMRFLGTIYYIGRGVERNYPQACDWYSRAANAGNSEAKTFYSESEQCKKIK